MITVDVWRDLSQFVVLPTLIVTIDDVSDSVALDICFTFVGLSITFN